MRIPDDEELARLEAEVAANPESEEARAYLLEALCGAGLVNDPRRFEQMVWFLEHNPRHVDCTTPFFHVDPQATPEVFAELKERWLTLLNDKPDSDIARGAALFIAAESLDEAKRILRTAIDTRPDEARLWVDLGRMSEDPQERLSAYERAAELRETLPNLVVWIATSSVKAGNQTKAEHAARQLMQLVDDARERFGEKLDWPERGADLWKRAKATCGNTADASELSDAIAQHAYCSHWGNTVLGLLACERGDIDRAVFHLRASAAIRPEYRLSAYGPSLDLLREICARGRWNEGLEYLHAWERMWNDDRVKGWLAAVREHRLPRQPDPPAPD